MEVSMKVLLINGSSREKGCTDTALMEVVSSLAKEGIESEIVSLGNKPVRDCTACGKCGELDNACVFNDDIVNEIRTEQAITADIIQAMYEGDYAKESQLKTEVLGLRTKRINDKKRHTHFNSSYLFCFSFCTTTHITVR